MVVTKGDVILPIDLPPAILQQFPRPVQSSEAAAPPRPVTLSAGEADLPGLARTLFAWARSKSGLKIIPAVERELIINALAETKGNQVQAAKLLGITRATLRKRVDKFGIKQELSVH
jgi:two-component system nitrogen regulation response regulator GlnG